MRYIATWSFEPFRQNSRHEIDLNLKHECIVFAALASLSIESFAREFNTTPIIYTDSIGVEAFASLPCETVNVYDGVFDTISPRMWAYPKVLTYGMQTEPYLHFDLDFFINRPFDHTSTDVVTQCIDDCEETYTVDPRSFGFTVPDFMYDYIVPSATVGVLGMNNMALNAEYARLAKECMEANQHLDIPTGRLNTICEQQLLTSLMARDGHTMSYMHSQFDGPGQYYHFAGHKKIDYHIRPFIMQYLTTDHRAMARKIYELL